MVKNSPFESTGTFVLAKKVKAEKQKIAVRKSDYQGKFSLTHFDCSHELCMLESCGLDRYFGSKGCRKVYECDEQIVLKVIT